jgi:hypothetical protein
MAKGDAAMRHLCLVNPGFLLISASMIHISETTFFIQMNPWFAYQILI